MPAHSTSTKEHQNSNDHRRVLVSGGAGFIGSHLVDQLLDRGHAVTVVDNLSTGRRANLPDEHPRLRFIEADVAAALDAFGPGERFDRVYHLAASVGVKLVMDDPIAAIENNVEQTAALLRFVESHRDDLPGGVPTLIVSSSEVYGKLDSETFSEDDDVVYGPTTVGRWAYAGSKAMDEYLALAYHRTGRAPTSIVRLFNTVGPRQVGAYGMVLPRFVAAAIKGEPLEVHGDGEQSRCFCDVRDVVDALALMLESPGCLGQVVNIGSDRAISIRDLATMVLAETGSDSKIRTISYDQAYPPGFEDLHRRKPDLDRARRLLGFDPKINLEQTIRDVAAWLRENDP